MAIRGVGRTSWMHRTEHMNSFHLNQAGSLNMENVIVMYAMVIILLQETSVLSVNMDNL